MDHRGQARTPRLRGRGRGAIELFSDLVFGTGTIWRAVNTERVSITLAEPDNRSVARFKNPDTETTYGEHYKGREMAPSTPFVDQETGRIDRGRVLAEAIPLAELVVLVGVIILVPVALKGLLFPFGFGAVFTILTQLILAVGGGVVLMYVISRAFHLASE